MVGEEKGVYQDLKSQTELELKHWKIGGFDKERLVVLFDEFHGEVAKKLRDLPRKIEELTGVPKDNLIFVIASAQSLSAIKEGVGELPWLPAVEVDILEEKSYKIVINGG